MTSSAAPVRIGVVGTGALGRNHVRLLASLDGADLIGHVDADPTTSAAVADEFGSRAWPETAALAGEVEAMVVAVPTSDHLGVARPLLESGLHVLVEKPIATSLEEADQLIAAAGDRVLAVGHVEFYNPAVQALLGVGQRARYLEVQRLGVFSPRSLDVDVVLDLMIHDLQILHALDDSGVDEIRATGVEVLSDRIDIANVRVAMKSGCVANLTASRVSSERVRKLRAFLSQAYYSLDYQEQSIKGYRLSLEAGERVIAPSDLPVTRAEPLKAELEAFVAACRGESVPYVDGLSARRALETAMAAVDTMEAAAAPLRSRRDG